MEEKMQGGEKNPSEENVGGRIEDIQEKTSFYLSKLFEYFGSEGS